MVVVGQSNNLISSVFSFQEWPAAGASRKVKQVRQEAAVLPRASLWFGLLAVGGRGVT